MLVIGAGPGVLHAQDPLYSQFFANPLHLNPALTGVEGAMKFHLGYRNQWPGETDTYVSYHASLQKYMPGIKSGLGFLAMNDRQGGGVFNTMSAALVYAYHLKVTRQMIVTAGFQAGAGQLNLRTDKLVLPDQLAGNTGNDLRAFSKLYPDFALGAAVFIGAFYGGIAVQHVLEPYSSPGRDPNTRVSRKYTLHAGALIPIYERRLGKEVLQLSPNLVFMQQDVYQHMNYGVELRSNRLVGGVWLRQDLAFSYASLIFSVGYGNEQIRLRYSYDTKLSAPSVNIPTMGAHELSMVIVVEKLYKSTKRRAIKCPKF